MNSSCDSDSAGCCARFYEDEWVQQMLGESFHPGGLDLSARLIESLQLPPRAKVLDVACGIGSTTLLMAQRFRFFPIGLDASGRNLKKARGRAFLAPISNCGFVKGTAASLPFADERFDAVICECALSAFAHQAVAVAEFARVLKPGGKVGISDMCLEGELQKELVASAASWTCLSGARSAAGYAALLDEAGFRSTGFEDETAALTDLVDSLKRKLLLIGVVQLAGSLASPEMDVERARGLLNSARSAVQNGDLKYARMVGELSRRTSPASPS